jgi:rhomboid protease GlpG
MRQIGQLPDEPQGRVFGDFLVARGIRNEIEREADGSVSVWIHDEDQLAAAQQWLVQFRTDPKSAEFRKATAEAARMRTAEAKNLAEYRQRIRTGRNIFPKFGGYGVGILTYALIVVCVVVAIYSKLGTDPAVLRNLFITDPEGATGRSLPEVFSGEVWRLFTPIFVHFGWLHLIFNMMWLYQLGCMIEGRQGSLLLAALVAVVALCSNLAQYYFAGPSFGGMSGVVYGLAGYVWMRGKYDRASGLYLDPQSVTILLVWLVVCYTGYVGDIANTAHLVGLIVGVVWGRVSAYLASGKPG